MLRASVMLLAAIMLAPPHDIGFLWTKSVFADVTIDEINGAGDGVGQGLLLGATDPGNFVKRDNTSGNNASNDSQSESNLVGDPLSGLGQTQPDQWCGWSQLANLPPANDPAWAGHNPSEGTLRWQSCSVLFPGTPGAPGNPEGRPVVLQFFANGAAAPPPPPPNPAVLAQQAIGQLRIPPPSIGAGPDRTTLAVNLWTWLWIDDPGPLTVTVAAGGVSVTATATLTTTTWSLGEPADSDAGYTPGPPVTITCQGTGSPPPPNHDWKQEPPCGHQYRWRSLKERTGGTGAWPVSATSTWTVTWQSNTGVAGGTTLAATTTDALDIGEYRAVLVRNPGG